MENKQCQKCKQSLPLTEFHKDKTNKDNLNRWCIACKRVSRFKNCQIPEVYLKRRWDGFGKVNKHRKTQRAKKDITYKELLELFNNFCNENIKQGKHRYSCRYTGDVMTFFQGKGQVGSNLSIDRIDNNKTYTKNNITFCTQNFNHKKGQLTVDTMMKVLKVFKEEGII